MQLTARVWHGGRPRLHWCGTRDGAIYNCPCRGQHPPVPGVPCELRAVLSGTAERGRAARAAPRPAGPGDEGG